MDETRLNRLREELDKAQKKRQEENQNIHKRSSVGTVNSSTTD